MKNRLRYAPSVVCQQRTKETGLSLFEFAIVVIVFAILVTVLLERLAYYQYESEKAQVRLLVTNMRSALSSKRVEALVKGKTWNLSALDSTNPVALLDRRPADYFGEVDKLAAESVPPGHWYFDRTQAMLVYVFTGKKSFPGDSFERWYFKVKFTRWPTARVKPDGASDLDGSVALIQIDEHQ